MVRQCTLLGLARSTAYYEPQPVSAADLDLMRRLDERHLEHPFLGSRRLRDALEDERIVVNRKHVQRLMRVMGIAAVPARRNTNRRIRPIPCIRACCVTSLLSVPTRSGAPISPMCRWPGAWATW